MIVGWSTNNLQFLVLVEERTKADMFCAQWFFDASCTLRDFGISPNKWYSRSYVHITMLIN